MASGTISVYERDGVYQLYVDSLAPEGTGDLQLAFEQLKAKLTEEGLFEQSCKKPLPVFPKRIGVVTSLAGAVLRDIYHVSKHRWPQIQLLLHPVQVQGEGSAEQIAAAIEFFNKLCPVDVLIVGRGGGSMEDLWSFNEECVVRAIYGSKIPVISAVGHETDFTLSDFVADVRAATPSNAAELAVPDCREVARHIQNLQARLTSQVKKGIESRRLRLNACLRSPVLASPQTMLAARRQRLDYVLSDLQRLTEKGLTTKQHRLNLLLERLDSMNPAGVLRRGYTMAEKRGKLVTSIREVSPQDKLTLLLADGRAAVEVLDITANDKAGKEGR